MQTVRLTTAQAIVRYLMAQKTVRDDGTVDKLFPGVFAIFGHGNVTCLGHALEEVKHDFPTWRGQNEQGMALAATGFAKAARRRQIMVATSSIGPGATNMVTAAGVAMANRLPLLLLSGDTFQSRIPDPVLQQVEPFGEPSTTVNDAFRPVVRYWDRLTRPEQVVQSLPHAVHTMLDPADCGPAFIGLPQDVQAEAYDYPVRFFDEAVHEIRRPRADSGELDRATAAVRSATKPLIIAGGGVHWSLAEAELAAFAEVHNIPVVETVAGRATMVAAHPLNAGPIGVTGCTSANALAAEADVVIAVGTRLQDFSTGSWTVFRNESVRFVGLNTARFDATKHQSMPLVADAREGLADLGAHLDDWRSGDEWAARCTAETSQYHAYIDKIAAKDSSASDDPALPTYAQVVGVVDRAADDKTYALTAAGGLPGELVNGWRAKAVSSFDAEYGFSCMGYEIAGGWGAKMARPESDVVVFVGDGSYMMMNSDLYSTVLTGHKLIVIVCDNGGFAVINRLQVNQGGVPFNNLIADSRVTEVVAVDFAAHAAAMGCESETVHTIDELESAYERARAAERTYVIALRTSADDWTEGGSFWEVGVPEVSNRPAVLDARAEVVEGKVDQRVGW
ncbi:MAG: 3D-(3,5/4)-trihydroxycyclohexane-1,2-dione acylhydrolase (decyclizing) [Acidimicrobiia bacterium]|nr:3D-(3,5/4)-trihydroxycyclohexane-1,2-dione acylhydrolase (decyclizing) [Acidimicrobiia bacterium]